VLGHRRELACDAIAYPGVFRRALAQGRLHLLSLRAGHAEMAFRVGPIFSPGDLSWAGLSGGRRSLEVCLGLHAVGIPAAG